MIKEYIRGRSCAILGLGVSNAPLAEYICREGIALSVYDKADAAELGERALQIEKAGAEFFKRDKLFSDIKGELVFRSPGIRPDKIETAEGAELTSEAELFLKLTPARTFAITGSDGKTTTTTLTGKFLEAAGGGRTFVGGNIGKPLLCECEGMTPRDNAVLELSSFQLMRAAKAPEYAAITNISPNHLDWHTDMSEYISAKMNIVGEDTRRLVTNADNEETFRAAQRFAKRQELELFLFSSSKHTYEEIFKDMAHADHRVAFYEKDGYITADNGHSTERLLDISNIQIPGRHNIENYMTAIALTYGFVPYSAYKAVAQSFFGVEHRLELVRELDGIRYYNSSIDSSPTRTAAALSALAGESIVLICGGYDKKIPYAPLAEAICRHGGVRAVALTGATGEKIGREIELYRSQHGCGREIKLCYNAKLSEAVEYARGAAEKGDCVLLSPASASFDAFKNFAERGAFFKKTVMSMK